MLTAVNLLPPHAGCRGTSSYTAVGDSLVWTTHDPFNTVWLTLATEQITLKLPGIEH